MTTVGLTISVAALLISVFAVHLRVSATWSRLIDLENRVCRLAGELAKIRRGDAA